VGGVAQRQREALPFGQQMQAQVPDKKNFARLNLINDVAGTLVSVEQHHHAVADDFQLAAFGDEHGRIFFQAQADAAGISGLG
jgi:hypothetical protein